MNRPERPHHDRRWRLVILGSCILIFISSSLYGFFRGFEDPQHSWNGYYSLVIDSSASLDSVDAALASAGIVALSAHSALVGISDGASISWEPQGQLSAQSTAGDIRIDPFVQRVGNLFRDRDSKHSVIYLPIRENIAPLMLHLSRVLGPLGISWQLMEWRPLERLLLLTAAALIAVLLIITSKKQRFLMAVSLVPWLALAGSVGPAFFAFHVMMIFSWALVLECLVPSIRRYAHDVPQAPFFWDRPSSAGHARESLKKILPYIDIVRLRARLIVYCLGLFAFIVCAAIRGSWELIPGIVLVPLFVWPTMLILVGRLYQIRQRRSEHMLFVPIPILTHARSLHSGLRPVLVPVALICLLVPIGFFFFGGATSTMRLPVPAGQVYGGLDWASLTRAEQDQSGRVSNADSLPGTSDYVFHRAFQDALPYLQTPQSFVLPENGTTFGLEHFDFSSNGVTKRPEKRLILGDSWLSGLRADSPETSVDRLFLSQGRMVGLVFSPSGTVYSADIWSLPALAGLACLLVPLWVFGRGAGTRQFYGARRVPAWSRKIAA